MEKVDGIYMGELKVNSWCNPNKERYSKTSTYVHPFLVASKNKTKQSFKVGYEDLMTVTTMFNYSLSDGILKKNPEADDTFMYLNSEGIDDVFTLPNEFALNGFSWLFTRQDRF